MSDEIEAAEGKESVNLSLFDGSTMDRGKPKWFEICWWLVKVSLVQSKFPWPSSMRKWLLRLFGAKIGAGFYIRPSVNIHFPWKLEIGDDVWIGEGTTILNLEPVIIHSNTALAHEVYIAAASHDISSPTFGYKNEPITIESGVWLATRSYIGPGVTVGRNAVVAACACVVTDVPPGAIVGGVPAKVIGKREMRIA